MINLSFRCRDCKGFAFPWRMRCGNCSWVAEMLRDTAFVFMKAYTELRIFDRVAWEPLEKILRDFPAEDER